MLDLGCQLLLEPDQVVGFFCHGRLPEQTVRGHIDGFQRDQAGRPASERAREKPPHAQFLPNLLRIQVERHISSA